LSTGLQHRPATVTPCCHRSDDVPHPSDRGGGLLDQLELDLEFDAIADDSAAIEHRVEGQPELAAIDLPLGAVGDAVTEHARVVELAVPQDLQRDRVDLALDGQIAGMVKRSGPVGSILVLLRVIVG
jgi:hypothetical protein